MGQPEIRPSYYKVMVMGTLDGQGHKTKVEVECFDLIDALGFDFFLGNALKYLFRCAKKHETKEVDLRKAATYCIQAADREEKDLPF